MRVLIVDDHPIYAEGLRNLLRSRDYGEVEIASDGAAAVERASAWKPEVVLMDVNMPVMDGIQATRLIKRGNPEAKVVMLTSLGDEENLVEAVRAGASGYLLKTSGADQMIECFELLQEGKNPFSAGLMDVLLQEFRQREPRQAKGGGEALAPRAKEILRLLSESLTYKEIGSRLFLSERTIKYHIECIKKTLGLESKAELMDYWRERGGS
jgi:DNA-binding NarL/FixJ family response regulator